MSSAKLTRERLLELFSYRPETGQFIRLVTTRNNAKAGQEAGCANRRGYVEIRVDGKLYKAHRLAFLYMTGKWPNDEVDHIDGCRGNNRWGNLRDVPKSLNQQNRQHGANINGSSGLLGVHWSKARGKWLAIIKTNKVRKYLGGFVSPEQASAAYLKAKQELHPCYSS